MRLKRFLGRQRASRRVRRGGAGNGPWPQRGTDRRERPEVAGMVEPVVLHPSAADGGLLSGGSGDGRGTGIGLEPAGIGEPSAVVSCLGQHPGTELDAKAGKAGDDLGVRVLRESFLHGLGQVVGGGAGGLQLALEGERLLAECVFDQLRLAGPIGAEDVAEPVCLGGDASLAAGSFERGLYLGASEHCGLARRRGEAEQFAGFGAAETVLPGGEGVQGSGKVLAKQRAELVGDLLPVPGGVLLGTGQDCDDRGPGRCRWAAGGGRACPCAGCWPGRGRRRGRTSCGRRCAGRDSGLPRGG